MEDALPESDGPGSSPRALRNFLGLGRQCAIRRSSSTTRGSGAIAAQEERAASIRAIDRGPDSASGTPSKTIIDNDNFTQVLEEAESRHLANTSMLYSFEGAAKMFQISSPDVTCSLSFNGHVSSLLARPVVPIDLPDEETRKLEGPAVINEEGLQVSVFNGTRWKVEEITVGVTLVRRANLAMAHRGLAKLVPAASETTIVAEKPADVTTLYHLKGEAMPSSTTVFKAPLTSALGPDEEWHWAIVQARGIPPRPEDSALSQPLAPATNRVIP